MERFGLIRITLTLAAIAGLGVPYAALADEVTLNVPVRLTRMAANVTRGLVTCEVSGMWTAPPGRGAVEPLRQQFRVTGTSELAIDGTTGEFSGTRTVRITTPPPPQAWRDASADIRLDGTPRYYCHVQIGAAGSAWLPQLNVIRSSAGVTGERTDYTITTPPPVWAESRSTSDAILVQGNLGVIQR